MFTRLATEIHPNSKTSLAHENITLNTRTLYFNYDCDISNKQTKLTKFVLKYKVILAFLLLTLPFLSFTQSLMSKFDSFLNLLRASEMSNISIFWFPLFPKQRFINLLGILWKHLGWKTGVVVFKRNLITRTI